MNKVLLVGRLTRDPELRTLPSGKHVTTFSVATNEYRGQNAGERTEYHAIVAWDYCTVDANRDTIDATEPARGADDDSLRIYQEVRHPRPNS
jgi:single stranded DNA-binding protein